MVGDVRHSHAVATHAEGQDSSGEPAGMGPKFQRSSGGGSPLFVQVNGLALLAAHGVDGVHQTVARLSDADHWISWLAVARTCNIS